MKGCSFKITFNKTLDGRLSIPDTPSLVHVILQGLEKTDASQAQLRNNVLLLKMQTLLHVAQVAREDVVENLSQIFSLSNLQSETLFGYLTQRLDSETLVRDPSQRP